jgi:uncharacterized membrane protein
MRYRVNDVYTRGFGNGYPGPTGQESMGCLIWQIVIMILIVIAIVFAMVAHAKGFFDGGMKKGEKTSVERCVRKEKVTRRDTEKTQRATEEKLHSGTWNL